MVESKEMGKQRIIFCITIFIFSLVNQLKVGAQTNYSNKIISEYVNMKYQEILSLDSSQTGYKVNNYDTLVIINSIEDNLNSCYGQKTLDSNAILTYLDKKIIENKVILFSDTVSNRLPSLYVLKFTCTFQGFWGECEIRIRYSRYTTPFYYSRAKNKLIILDETSCFLD